MAAYPPAGPIPAKISSAKNRRILVLCFDGTSNHSDAPMTSNVRQFFSLLKKDEQTKQKVSYQDGYGVSPIRDRISKTFDAMTAGSLEKHVLRGYTFLMHQYQPGDKIYLFGFSRGAYTARALAGMIHKVGILPIDNCSNVDHPKQLWKTYKSFATTDREWQNFRDDFVFGIDVEFLGAWDTVRAVAVPLKLPFTTSHSGVKTIRHALSLDERRTKFKAFHFNRSVISRDEQELDHAEKEFCRHHKCRCKSDVLEVWFSGCHSDVGGGAVLTGTRPSLARISLRWMIRQCFLANTGILFDTNKLPLLGLDWNTLFPVVLRRPTMATMSDIDVLVQVAHTHVRAEGEDLEDIKSEMHDQLALNRGWHLFEFLPLRHRVQRKHGEEPWTFQHRPNMGKGRQIPDEASAKVHWTVNVRMKMRGLDSRRGLYVPKAKFDPKKVVWVD